MKLFTNNFKEKLMAATRQVLYGKKHPFWLGVYEWEHRDKNGELIAKWTTENALADEGEENLLDAYFRDQNVPPTFYLMLVDDTPEETDSLADIMGEPSTNGYERQEITRDSTSWPTLELDSGDYMITSAQVIFQATGGSWGPVTYSVLTTVGSGTAGPLISYVALSQSRTLSADETLGCTIRIKLQ